MWQNASMIPAKESIEVFAKRRQRLRDAARKTGCDAVAIYGEGSARGLAAQSHAAIRYLTGFDTHEAFSILFITDDKAELIVSSPFLMPSAHASVPELDLSFCTPDRWMPIMAEKLKLRKRAGTVNWRDAPTWLSGAVALDNAPTLDRLLHELRMVKTRPELASLRAGAAICDTLFALLPDAITMDKTCWETQVVLENEARSMGAEYCNTWLTVAPAADYPRYWPEEGLHIPAIGDQVLFGIALTVNGYWAHGIRMGAVGSISASHHSLWQQVRQMLLAGLDSLHAGAPMSGVERAIDSILRAHYHADDIANINRFRNGHGLGLSYEEPVLNDFFPQHFTTEETQLPEHEVLIEPGMVFELHPNLFLPGVGGAALGEMLVVTEDGAPERLLKTPTNPFLVPPV